MFCFCFFHRQRRAETVQTTWILKHCQYANKIKIEFIMSTYVFLIHKTIQLVCYTVCNYTLKWRQRRRRDEFYFALEFRLWISINNLALMESAAVCTYYGYMIKIERLHFPQPLGNRLAGWASVYGWIELKWTIWSLTLNCCILLHAIGGTVHQRQATLMFIVHYYNYNANLPAGASVNR